MNFYKSMTEVAPSELVDRFDALIADMARDISDLGVGEMSPVQAALGDIAGYVTGYILDWGEVPSPYDSEFSDVIHQAVDATLVYTSDNIEYWVALGCPDTDMPADSITDAITYAVYEAACERVYELNWQSVVDDFADFVEPLTEIVDALRSGTFKD